jgi:dCTP deaminase
MSILTKVEILKEIKKGRIKIEPFNPANVGVASIDLELSDEFRVFEYSDEVLDVYEQADLQNISCPVKQSSITIPRGEMILGITKEKITLPEDIGGWVEGRSRFARLGLVVHLTAPFSNPNIDNRIVLEICNLGSRPLRLSCGLKICQFIFEKSLGKCERPRDFSGL